MIHILYRPTQSKPGYVNQIGYYMNYAIGRIPDEYIDSRIELHKFDATVIPENIAPGFKFADIYKDSMSIRINSHIMDEFPMLQSSEAENEKVKYFLTDEDKALAVRFNKVVMIKVISDRFTEKLKELMLDASLLEKATWEEQKREALLYQQDNTTSTPLIDILAEGREITKSELVDKILLNVNSYNIKLANLLVEQQKLEKKVKDCQTIADCHRLRHEKFGISVSYQQQMDENIPTTPLTLQMDF
jgi:hypothetical protein